MDYIQPPHAHLAGCISLAISCSTLYRGPELSSGRTVKLEELYFGAFFVPYTFPLLLFILLLLSSRTPTFDLRHLIKLLLVTYLHSKLPVLFTRLLAFHVFLLTVGDNGASHHLQNCLYQLSVLVLKQKSDRSFTYYLPDGF